MVFIAAGETFATNGTLTVDGLHTMVDGGVATSFSLGDFAPSHNLRAIQVTGTNPGTDHQGIGSMWYDTARDRLLMLATNSATTNVWSDPYDALRCGNLSTHIPAGSIVKVIGVEQGAAIVTLCDAVADTDVSGVAEATIPQFGSEMVKKFGIVQCRVSGLLQPGDLLVAGDIDGVARSSTYLDPNGNFETSIAFGQALYAKGASATALVTIFAFI